MPSLKGSDMPISARSLSRGYCHATDAICRMRYGIKHWSWTGDCAVIMLFSSFKCVAGLRKMKKKKIPRRMQYNLLLVERRPATEILATVIRNAEEKTDPDIHERTQSTIHVGDRVEIHQLLILRHHRTSSIIRITFFGPNCPN